MDTNHMEQNEQQEGNIKGFRIQTISYFMIIASFVFYLLILYITIQLSNHYNALIHNIDTYTVCSEDARVLEEASDYLTDQVRLYVMTTDSKYMDAYMDELTVSKRRENALKNLQNTEIGGESLTYLQHALSESNHLAQTELYAIRLVKEAKDSASDSLPDPVKEITLSAEDAALSYEDKLQKARTMVFDADYLHAKELIKSDISSCLNAIISDTLEAKELSADTMERTLFRQRIYISILFCFSVITFLMLIILIVKPLKIYINCMKEEKMLSITGAYEFKYLAFTYNDIYNLKRVNEAVLRQHAEQDPLTGLANRRAFDDLRQILNTDIPLVLFIIDVDYFKEVNDNYGHQTGDYVLQKVADSLQKSFRSEDFVIRIGGDEFAAIITRITLEQRSVFDQKAIFLNEFLSDTSDGLPAVTLSIGAAYSDHGFTDDLYNLADKALYYVKKSGRNGYALYQDISEQLSK